MIRDGQRYEPCPTCHQYSNSVVGGLREEAAMHFNSMFSHREDGIPTQFNFDEKTRDLVQRLIAAIPDPTARSGE